MSGDTLTSTGWSLTLHLKQPIRGCGGRGGRRGEDRRERGEDRRIEEEGEDRRKGGEDGRRGGATDGDQEVKDP